MPDWAKKLPEWPTAADISAEELAELDSAVERLGDQARAERNARRRQRRRTQRQQDDNTHTNKR
jgi:hypothetical protein